MNESPKKKRPRRRRRRGKATAPLTAERVLDLAKPSDRPLTDAEIKAATDHLAFLRRFKKALRLSLNATEDLLVNGVRPPAERGVLKHLFAKIDRHVIDHALGREPLSGDIKLRATFLGGVVRLRPEHDTLLRYLEAVADTADRREAARAFQLTIERMSFADASTADLARTVTLVQSTFTGADRTRAYLGLLAADSFRSAWRAAKDRIDPEIRAPLRQLEAAFDVIVGQQPLPEDEQRRHVIEAGLDTWLDAPAAILDSYAPAVRARLAEVALQRTDRAPAKALASLVDGLPREGADYRRLALLYGSALARAGDKKRASNVVRQIAEAFPRDRHVKRIEEALGWPSVGPIAIEAAKRSTKRAFSMTDTRFGWARTAPAAHASTLVAETRLMLDLLVPNIATVTAHGLAKDGTAYVFMLSDGYPLDEERQPPRLPDALARADTAVRLLRTLAAFGVELPDAEPWRFLVRGGNLMLLDLSGAQASAPARAALTNGPLAQSIAVSTLSTNGDLRSDLGPELTGRLRVRSPLVVLALALARARNDVGGRRG